MTTKITLIFSLLLFISCNSDYTLKPRGYFKIDLPEKKYRPFNDPSFPYSFEYPAYAQISKDSLFFEEKAENPYWINIDFPQFNGRIHISYKQIGRHKLDSLVNDAFTMSYKQHSYKASAIEPEEFTTPNNLSGVYFHLKGNTATANQFFVTDSTDHFLRGALYFNAVPKEDSIKPVNDFLQKDMQHLINTLQWK